MVDVVIARYKESLDWVNLFDVSKSPNVKFFIYNKSDEPFEVSKPYTYKSLPNIGREAHTFLHHIVHNYDNLAEETLFLQGYPFDHHIEISMLQYLIEKKANYDQFRTFAIVSVQPLFIETANVSYNLIFNTLYKDLSPPPQYIFSSGAQYIVKKEAILRHSKATWSKLLEMSETDTQFPWSVERIWMYMYSDCLLQ